MTNLLLKILFKEELDALLGERWKLVLRKIRTLLGGEVGRMSIETGDWLSLRLSLCPTTTGVRR